MNTSKILDIVPSPMPAPTQAPTQAPAGPARPDSKAVQPIGGGATTDLIQQRAQRQAEAVEEERERPAKAYVRPHNFDREVGLVGQTFEVFVDLVHASVGDHRFRIFGPSESANPLPASGSPANASAAYSDAGVAPRIATLKTEV
jgi:hypothetical protein